MDIITNCKDGRIEGINNALVMKYGKQVCELDTKTKLDALCESLLLSHSELDDMISSNSQSLRAVKGHCFEVAFQFILSQNGYYSEDIGGDSDIDLKVNNHLLQLKTPNMSGTDDFMVEYKTHKTHGSKSQAESMDYYHKVEDFADFFVGLISYNPFMVFIVPKEKLPRRIEDNRYIDSPFKLNLYSIFDGGYNTYVNNYKSIGITINDSSIHSILPKEKELLPKTAKAIGLNTDIIVESIIRKENFRVWDMNIRGFAREYVLKKILASKEIKFLPCIKKKSKNNRGEKADLKIFLESNSPSLVQVKGLSVTKCSFDGINSQLLVETQLTRGRYNNHPTQSRLYQWNDFEYLVIGVDPSLSYMIFQKARWTFYLIPSSILERYNKYQNRYNYYQVFEAKALEKYLFCTYG